MSPGLYGDVSRTQQEAMACFPIGTMIETINGSKSIETIQIGDLVLTHKGRFMPVTNLYKRNYEGLLWSVDADHSFKATSNHPILVNNEWVEAEKLEEHLDKGLSLYGWNPRRGRIFEFNDKTTTPKNETPRIGITNSPLCGGRAKLSATSNIRLSPRNLWRNPSRSTFETRETMDIEISETRHPILGSRGSLHKGKTRSSGYYSPSMQENNTEWSGVKQLRNMGMVFETSCIDELHKLRNKTSEIDQSLNTFRPTPITNIKTIWHDGYVYNLGVGNDNSYVAEGFIVHNCGCPVVSWDTDPYGDAHSYRYAKAFNTEDLAEKLMDVYNEVLDDREGVAQRSRNLAEKYFDINDEAKQIVGILRQVVEET